MIFTPDERRALICLLGLLALGLFAHWIAPGPLPPEGGGDSLLVLLADQPATAADTGGSAGEPRGAAPSLKRPMWINRASADELADLPRVGPAIARRIVEVRSSRGPFRSEEDLMRVRGIGPKTARCIAPFVTFATDTSSAGRGEDGARAAPEDSLGH